MTSGWLNHYISVECCVVLSVDLVAKRPLGANQKGQGIVSWFPPPPDIAISILRPLGTREEVVSASWEGCGQLTE